MKYVIDIPNDGQCQYKYNEDTKELKFPCPRIDPNSFMGLDIVLTGATPYTEPDEDEIRQKVENEVWDFATSCIDMDGNDFYTCFGNDSVYYLTEYTYSEAKSKYDEWKRKEEEVRVGDEVETELGNKACVLYGNPDGTLIFVLKADGTAAWWSRCAIHKTGKNHSEIAELLKKMRNAE